MFSLLKGNRKSLTVSNWLVLSAAVVTLGLSGCSSNSTKNAQDVLDYDADTDYRTTEKKLDTRLEIPPNLFAPSSRRDGFADALDKTQGIEVLEYDYVPSYQAKGLKINSNLAEQWLEIEGMSSDEVWEGVQAFLESLGLPVVEARRDIGIIRTKFVGRKEIVPLDNQGPLTRLLNSWRTEFAEGIYDRFNARVEYDVNSKITRVYFHHYMLFDPAQVSNEETELGTGVSSSFSAVTGWVNKPYNPMMEAETLYQAMIFFGASQADSIKNIQLVENQVEVADGDTEFDSLKVNASVAQTWGHLKATLYRAGWQINRINPNLNQVWVDVPADTRKETSFTEKLAFWRSDEDSQKALPQVVKFTVERIGDDASVDEISLLKVSAINDDEVLDADKKKYVFESLGLIAQ